MSAIKYPFTATTAQVDNYHGTLIHDPYRWLEDTDSPQTREWIETQNSLTFSFLENIPVRETIRQRLRELWDYPKAYAPRKIGGRYFQLRNSGLQNQDVLYTFDSLVGEKLVLLDPNQLSEDGTIALTDWRVSQDARYLAYSTSSGGSDWQTWHIRDIRSGEDLPDNLEWSKFSSATWLPDSSGFFYTRYEPPDESDRLLEVNLNQKLYLHRLGTSQEKDELIYQRLDQPEWGFDAKVSRAGEYLVLHVWHGTDTRNRLFYKELSGSTGFIELISNLEAAYEFIGNDGPVFYLRTDNGAPKGQLIAVDLRKPGKPDWQVLIPESDDVLETVKIVNHQFVILYLHHAHHQLKKFDLTGSYLGEIQLPTLGSIVSINNELVLFGEREDDELFFSFHSFAYPPTAFRYSFIDDRSEALELPDLGIDLAVYRTDQVFLPSKDGAMIPMFLVSREGIRKDGSNPTLLYGYGGFNISITPTFMVNRLVWLEMGGILAVANLRGGGEYGEAWHRAGSLENKQNVFDDMIACAEYLIANRITIASRLAIDGRSNGCLLVGACITQRPELFGAALPAVGVMDMLRFHKFTIGWAWVSDYGSSDDPEQFKVLLKYSPLHNIKPGIRYPATLLTAGDHDDRVVPGHSFKFAAALQAAQAGDAPILIRIQTKAGHGFGKPTNILIEEQSDILAFLVEVLGIVQ